MLYFMTFVRFLSFFVGLISYASYPMPPLLIPKQITETLIAD